MESQMTLCERIKFASAKLFIEFFGTMVFTLLFCTGNDGIILIGLWMLTIFCWRISQSQLNPAVTLAYMFRHDSKKIHFSLGILMMGAQVAGAYVGALYVLFINWNLPPMIPITSNNTTGVNYSGVFPSIMQEIVGSFIFVLFFKIMTDERLHFSKENAVNCFVIASAYVASRQIVNGVGRGISSYGACLNPAIAIGISLGAAIQDPVGAFVWFWLFWLLPLGGSILAIIFYRLVYLKTQLMIMKDEVHEEDQNLDDIAATMKGDGILDLSLIHI